jgi:WD40 repeat protein
MRTTARIVLLLMGGLLWTWSISSGPSAARLVGSSNNSDQILKSPHWRFRHKDRVNAVAFLPDSRRIASASDDHTGGLWDIRAGRQLASLTFDPRAELDAVAAQPDGPWVVFGDEWGHQYLYRPPGASTAEATIQHPSGVRHLIFAPGHDRWVYGQWWDGEDIWLQDLTDARLIRKFIGARGEAHLTPDGRTLMAPHGTCVRVWNTQTGSYRDRPGHTAGIWRVTTVDQGRRAISVDDGGECHLWSVETFRELGRFKAGRHGGVPGLAATPDGHYVILGGSDGSLEVWDLVKLQKIIALRSHDAAVWHLALSPDGRLLASASWDGSIGCWEVGTWTELNTNGTAGDDASELTARSMSELR